MDSLNDALKWEFNMPQFWDFTNTIPQKRPGEEWFCPANISGPSFPATKKRRALRMHKPLNKLTTSQNHTEAAPAFEKNTTDVFDRLSRLSTISFSNKVHRNLPVKEKRPLKLYATQHKPQQLPREKDQTTHEDESQYQLVKIMSNDSVADKITRIEKGISAKSDNPLKRKMSSSAPFQQKKIQKIIKTQISPSEQNPEHSSITIVHCQTPSNTSDLNTTEPYSKYPSVQPLEDKPLPTLSPKPTSKRRSLYKELQNSHINTNSQLNGKVSSKPAAPVNGLRTNQENITSISPRVFFENLLRSNQKRYKQYSLQSRNTIDTSRPTESPRAFFENLLKINQERYRNYDPQKHLPSDDDDTDSSLSMSRSSLDTAKKPLINLDSTKHIVDYRIERAREALKTSKGRTQKWTNYRL